MDLRTAADLLLLCCGRSGAASEETADDMTVSMDSKRRVSYIDCGCAVNHLNALTHKTRKKR